MRSVVVALTFALAIVSVACGPATIATPAVVARQEGAELRICTVRLGWGSDELLERCGSPLAVFKWADNDGECWVYDTLAQTFNGPQGAAAYAVCLGPIVSRYRSRKTGTVTSRHVVEVVGLSGSPGRAPVVDPPE